MDWQVILTSVITSLVSSSVIVAGIMYVLKRSFDRALDLRYEKLLEESHLRARESSRRDAQVYDKQVDILKEVLSLIYRLRNTTRDLAAQIEKEDLSKVNETMKRFITYHSALDEVILEERALLPPPLFNLAHESKITALPLVADIENISRGKKSDKLQELYISTAEYFKRIDRLYQLMVNNVQAQIGVVKEKDST
jgi:Na+-transporting NADH:ubiquinone oxidoreductase subunit NqrC